MTMFNGKKLAQIRRKKRISMYALCRLLHVEGVDIVPQTIYNYEKNKSVPTVDTLAVIAKLLNVDIQEFLQ